MHHSLKRVFDKIISGYAMDTRSLALFRFLLGALLLLNLGIKAGDLTAFYSDWGVFPRAVQLKLDPNVWHFSVYMASGQPIMQAIWFVVSAVFAAALLIGYRTRWAVFFSWILFASLELRNSEILTAGDRELRMMLFWSLFLPLGAHFSVDRAMSQEHAPAAGAIPAEKPAQIISFGVLGFMLQIAAVYWFTAMLKTGREWHGEGSAIYYALSHEIFVTPAGQYLLNFKNLLKPLTHATLFFETWGPFLILLPVLNKPLAWLRLFGIAAFVFLHLGFAACLTLGTFPLICLLSFVPFIPAFFWNELWLRFQPKTGQGTTIYFDGDCLFCRKSALLLRTFLILPSARVQPAQEQKDIFALMQEKNSWVVMGPSQEKATGFAAFTLLVQASPVFACLSPLLRCKSVQILGEALYQIIVGDRKSWSRLTASHAFRPMKLPPTWAGQTLAAFFILYLGFWNYGNINRKLQIPEPLRRLGYALRLEQNWAMFAPFPPRYSGWLVVRGMLKGGQEVNLLQEKKPVTWQRPKLLSTIYKNTAWRGYLYHLLNANYQQHRPYYGRYLCWDWNRKHNPVTERLERVEIVYFREMVLPEGKRTTAERIGMLDYNCFAPPPAPPKAPDSSPTPKK